MNKPHAQVLHAGETVCKGRYVIRRCVGEGKYAQVYEAMDRRMEAANGGDARVAIKILHPEYAADDEARQRLAREGRLQKHEALGRHRNVVAVLETGVHAYTPPEAGDVVGIPFLVMEYIEHLTLSDYFEQHRSRVPINATLLAIIQQLANALDWIHTHDQGVVHRDLADHNILLRCKQGANGCGLLEQQENFVQLTDFGLAFSQDEGTITHNRLDRIAANIRYAAPDILYGELPTPQDDVYSLGVLIFRLLTGNFPFPLTGLNEQEDLWDYAAQVKARPLMFPDPEAIPEAVQECLIKAMAKTRGERYDTAREMTAALIPALESWMVELQGNPPITAATASTTDPTASPPPRPDETSSESKTEEGLATVKPAAPEPQKPKRKRGGCLRWLLGVGLLMALGSIALIAAVINQWGPGSKSPELSPTVQLQPLTQTGQRNTPAATQAPAATALPTPTGIPTLAARDPTPMPTTPASAPAPGLAQAEQLDFVYVNAVAGASNIMGQSLAGDQAGFALFQEHGALQQLAWSPDAALLAYVSDAAGAPGVYVTDGWSSRRLSAPGVTEQWPTWRPDGNALVVSTASEGRTYLSLIDLATGAHSPLTGPHFNAWAPAWAPVGDYLAFVSDMDGSQDLYVLSLTDIDRAPVNVSRSGDVLVDTPAWAPDGKWLVYATRNGLRWVGVENLEPGAPRPFTQNGQDRAPCFLNDREILFQRTSGAGTVSIYQGRLGNETQQRVVDHAAWPACRR